MRALESEKQREGALSAFDAEGNALLGDAELLPVIRKQVEEDKGAALRQQIRRARKRWGAIPVPSLTAAAASHNEKTAHAVEHKYSTATFKISPRKLQLLASQINHKPIDLAILQMQFSPKRAAKRIKATLALARDHAVEKGMDPHRLVVDEAWVGKGRYLARAEFKGRARVGKRHHPSAKLSVVLRYGETWEDKEKKTVMEAVRQARSFGTGGIAPVQRPIVNVHQRPGWCI